VVAWTAVVVFVVAAATARLVCRERTINLLTLGARSGAPYVTLAAGQLVSRSQREALANALGRALWEAHHLEEIPLAKRPPPQVRRLCASSHELERIIASLHAGETTRLQGVALCRCLVTGGYASSLYVQPLALADLRQELGRIRHLLERSEAREVDGLVEHVGRACSSSQVSKHDSVRFRAPRIEMAVSRLERVAYPRLSLRSGPRRWRRIYLGVIARSRAEALHRQLAAGTSPRTSALLELRAQSITRCRSRARLADGLATVVRDAQARTPGLGAVVRPHRYEVIAARMVIDTLERRLRAPEPVTARAVALRGALLTDGASPLYRPDEPGALGSKLRAAAAVLEPTDGSDRGQLP
jgi:hypothetical protein